MKRLAMMCTAIVFTVFNAASAQAEPASQPDSVKLRLAREIVLESGGQAAAENQIHMVS